MAIENKFLWYELLYNKIKTAIQLEAKSDNAILVDSGTQHLYLYIIVLTCYTQYEPHFDSHYLFCSKCEYHLSTLSDIILF